MATRRMHLRIAPSQERAMTVNRPKHSGCDILAVGVAVPRMMMTGPIFQAVTLTSMSMSFILVPFLGRLVRPYCLPPHMPCNG